VELCPLSNKLPCDEWLPMQHDRELLKSMYTWGFGKFENADVPKVLH
jgi:hypothetical protein